MLMSTVAATPFTLTSCQDDLSTEELKANATVPSLLNTADLQALNTYSYEVPFEVKAKGEWRIDFEWEDGEQICYASPKQGKGDTKINICVLDNATDKHRTGEMIITDFGDNGKKTVVKLGQKSQLEDTRADKISTGNCIYGVGYGYNAMSGKLAANQIVKMADAIKDNILVTEGVRASYALREYKGSCFSQLCNNFKADASFSGKYFGFKGEAGASFDSKYLRESNRDYVISMVDVTTTQATLSYNRDQIIDAMTDADGNVDAEDYLKLYTKAVSNALTSAKAQKGFEAFYYAIAVAKIADDLGDALPLYTKVWGEVLAAEETESGSGKGLWILLAVVVIVGGVLFVKSRAKPV